MQRTTIRGSRLEQIVGIVAASSPVDPRLLERSLDRFARWQVPVCVDDLVHSSFRYFAGPDETRARAFDRLARDPAVGTLWCARGGYGSTRILPFLDRWKTAAALQRQPKLLIGYSDVTALHCYFYGKIGLPALHAPMPATPRWQTLSPRLDMLLLATLAGKLALGKHSFTAAWKPKVLIPTRSDAEGVILGGNLTLLVNLIGTPWQPDLRGSLLFLEDCAEAPYRVDRMLTHLANAGMFRGVRGVLLGDFTADVTYKKPAEKKYWRQIFAERFAPLGIPVLHALPVGHGKQNEPLPLGVKGMITKAGQLLLLEQPVRNEKV